MSHLFALFAISKIAYTEGCYMEIRVHSEVVDPRTGERDTTNVFHFTIVTENPVPLVWPKTYGGKNWIFMLS